MKMQGPAFLAHSETPAGSNPPAGLPPFRQRAALGLSAAAPPTLLLAEQQVGSLQEAQRICQNLAASHYENFSVLSRLVPPALRQDFANIYAFCRVADDLGDEMGSPEKSLQALGLFRRQLQECFQDQAHTAVFVALADTIARHQLPIDPFDHLIQAFEQDQHIERYESFEQLRDYCRRSADPVGRLVLMLAGYRDSQRQELSDCICTALQLANFWQDVRRDALERRRMYLPAEFLTRYQVTPEEIFEGRCSDKYRQMLAELVKRTHELFDQGEALLPLLDQSIRGQITLFAMGGRAILHATEAQNFDTLTRRPRLGKIQKFGLILRVLWKAARGWPA